MRELAKQHGMVLIVPFYEEAQTGVYYNSAVVIEGDGTVVGKYRKTHIPHVGPCFWEKFYFKPGNLGYPVFDTSVGKLGLIICYDRHFPEIGRALGLKGAELVFNPSATVESLSKYLWELEQPAHAVANGYWIAAINRVGTEEPLSSARFYGSSYFCDPRGQIVAKASDSEDEVLVHDVDLDKNREVRDTWQFLRDRRPGSTANSRSCSHDGRRSSGGGERRREDADPGRDRRHRHRDGDGRRPDRRREGRGDRDRSGRPADRTIDATRRYVMPGAVDVHTHMDLPFGGSFCSDDFGTGTRAAAFGGTTTIVDFALQDYGEIARRTRSVARRRGRRTSTTGST